MVQNIAFAHLLFSHACNRPIFSSNSSQWLSDYIQTFSPHNIYDVSLNIGPTIFKNTAVHF
jgi:hypothetical protein